MKIIFFLTLFISSLAHCSCPVLSGSYKWKGESAQLILKIDQTECRKLIIRYEHNGHQVMERTFIVDGKFHVVQDNSGFYTRQVSNWIENGFSYKVHISEAGSLFTFKSQGSFLLEGMNLIEDLIVYKDDGSIHSQDRQAFTKLDQ